MLTSHTFPDWLSVAPCAQKALQCENDPKVISVIEHFVRSIDIKIRQLVQDNKIQKVTLRKPLYTESYHMVVDGEDTMIKEIYFNELLEQGNLENETSFVNTIMIESKESDMQNS